MDEFDRLLADAPWETDLGNIVIRKAHPDWRRVNTPAQIREMTARGWALRAVFRSPYYPDGWDLGGKGGAMPVLLYGPPTEEERQVRRIGSQLADMVSGRDLRRVGLRRG